MQKSFLLICISFLFIFANKKPKHKHEYNLKGKVKYVQNYQSYIFQNPSADTFLNYSIKSEQFFKKNGQLDSIIQTTPLAHEDGYDTTKLYFTYKRGQCVEENLWESGEWVTIKNTWSKKSYKSKRPYYENTFLVEETFFSKKNTVDSVVVKLYDENKDLISNKLVKYFYSEDGLQTGRLEDERLHPNDLQEYSITNQNLDQKGNSQYVVMESIHNSTNSISITEQRQYSYY